MEPTIQLIHLMLRVEREAADQRHVYAPRWDGPMEKEPVFQPKQANLVKRVLDLFRRRQPYECV
jgi:hypothetical protein